MEEIKLTYLKEYTTFLDDGVNRDVPYFRERWRALFRIYDMDDVMINCATFAIAGIVFDRICEEVSFNVENNK